MIQKELLDLLRCPVCAKEEKGTLSILKIPG